MGKERTGRNGSQVGFNVVPGLSAAELQTPQVEEIKDDSDLRGML